MQKNLTSLLGNDIIYAKKTWQRCVFVNKDDILQMSREDNQNGDEREEKIKLRTYAVSAALGCLFCMILVFIEECIFDRSATAIWIIYSGMMFSKYIMDAVKLKKRFDIVLSVLWGLICIINIVIYIIDIIR